MTLPPEGGTFAPGSPEQVDLFEQAAKVAGLPPEWASEPGLQYILQRESGGRVGRPNYKWAKWLGMSFKEMSAHPEAWPKIWQVIREGKAKPSYTGINSHAAGLGQMQPSNMELYQPSGAKGVGVPLEEAVGMLKYIADRYGSPSVARQMYGQMGTYTHAITGKLKNKGFKEGY